jgi:hypothetical protein
VKVLLKACLAAPALFFAGCVASKPAVPSSARDMPAFDSTRLVENLHTEICRHAREAAVDATDGPQRFVLDSSATRLLRREQKNILQPCLDSLGQRGRLNASGRNPRDLSGTWKVYLLPAGDSLEISMVYRLSDEKGWELDALGIDHHHALIQTDSTYRLSDSARVNMWIE